MTYYLEVLRSVELLEDLDDASLADILAGGEEILVPRDNYIYHSGDVGTHFFIVLEGCVRIVIATDRRRKENVPAESAGFSGRRDRRKKTATTKDHHGLPLILLKTHNPGGFFGEMSLLTGDPVSADVIASEETRLLRLSKQVFEAAFTKNPSVLLRLNRVLSRYLSSTNVIVSNPPVAKINAIYRIGDELKNCYAMLNIAASVVRQTNKRVILVDLDSIMDGSPGRVLLKSQRKDLDIFDIHNTFGPHTDFGANFMVLNERLHALTFERPLGNKPDMDWSHIRHLFTVICGLYDIVIVDAGSSFKPAAASKMLNMADKVYLLTSNKRDHMDVVRMVKELDLKPSLSIKRLRIGIVGSFDFVRPSKILEPLVQASGIRNVFLLDSDEVNNLHMSVDGLPQPNKKTPTGRRLDSIAREIAGCSVGIALGSGGAKGFAHIGVWRVIEELGIPVDAIVGCSMGSIIGASFALGRDSQETEQLMRRLWTGKGAFFDWQIPPRNNIVKGKKVDRMADEAYEGKSVLDCVMPYAALAFDLISGQEIVINEGTIKNAVRSSGSMPIILRPVKWNNYYLIDGGVTNKVPVDVLAGMGTDFNIAVNVSPELDHSFYHPQNAPSPSLTGRIMGFFSRELREMYTEPSIFKVISRWYSTSSTKITEAHLQFANVTIRPNTEGISMLDWQKFDEAIRVGADSARQHAEEIQSKFSVLRGF